MTGNKLTWLLSAIILFGVPSALCAAADQRGDNAQTDVASLDLACDMSEGDRTWIDNAIAAWRLTSRSILGIKQQDRAIATFFDDDCVLSGPSVIGGGKNAYWSSRPHDGRVLLPDGNTIPVGVISVAAPFGDDSIFFVMSTPSVWQADVKSTMDLETLMVAVLIHEMSHTAQFATYGRRVSEIEKHGMLGLTDNVLQYFFGSDTEYAAAMTREIDLLFKAAAAPTNEEARTLALAARKAIDARHARWLTGQNAELGELDDLFLTLEGSGQWAGYAWLTSPEGGGVDRDTAIHEFGRRGGRWSQSEGLALFLVLDRLAPAWKEHAFGDGGATALEMLRTATETH